MIRSHHLAAILPISDAIAHFAPRELLDLMKTAVLAAGLNPVGETTAQFEPQGVSAVLLLEESHVALHIWTEERKVTVDIHICDFQQDNLAKAEKLADLLTWNLSGNSDRRQWSYLSVSG